MLHPDTEGLFDSGYQGQQKRQKKTKIPHKKSKKIPLTKEQKAANKALAKERILAEHVIRHLKIFRILKHDYRNRRKRFALRCNLIAALYNLGLEEKI
jgi:IS5 family transposase